MGRTRHLVAGTVLLCGLALAGCTAAETAVASDPSPTIGSPVSAVTEPVTDEETCTAFRDVQTIIFNVDIAEREGRMAEQERNGWYRLAARVLDQVPTGGEGPVSDAVTALREISPAIPRGAVRGTGFGSPEWESALTELHTACTDAGSMVAVEGFTGG